MNSLQKLNLLVLEKKKHQLLLSFSMNGNFRVFFFFVVVVVFFSWAMGDPTILHHHHSQQQKRTKIRTTRTNYDVLKPCALHKNDKNDKTVTVFLLVSIFYCALWALLWNMRHHHHHMECSLCGPDMTAYGSLNPINKKILILMITAQSDC
jgi:hypothetical protein